MTVSAAGYARWRETPLGAATERVELGAVMALAGPLAGRRVLDVGAGDGTYALEAAARGARVTALDVDDDMLAAALARAAARGVPVATTRGRAEDLPFDDGSFDVVLAVTVLCLLPDAEVAVREMARVLAPGGRVVLGELSRFSVWAAARRVRGWLGARPWDRARFWSRGALRALVEGAGLRAGASRGAVYFPPSGAFARAMAPIDPALSRLRAPGGAFLALAADRPEDPR